MARSDLRRPAGRRAGSLETGAPNGSRARESLRVLLAHNQYSVTGGAEVFYHEVARVLRANGHEVAMFSCAEPGLEVQGADLFPAVPRFDEGGMLAKLARLPSIIYNRDARARFAEMITRFRPDIIHAFAIYGRLTPSILDAARDAGVPVVLSCNDYKHLCPNYKLYHHGQICEQCKGDRFHRALANRCCHESLSISAASMVEAYVHSGLEVWRKNVSCFLFASQFMAAKTEEFWGKDKVRIDFLQNPFDAANHYVPAKAGGYLLYFGRLIGEKGVGVLLDAAQRAPEVPVVVVGDGPDRAALESRAAGLDNLRMVGPAWGEDLACWLEGARAVVVPSLWHENFPYVILQAFAAHLPVIGTNRGGIPELVEAGPHGWIYDAPDARALAGAMRTAMATADSQILKMGRAARAYAEETFSDAAIYRRLREIYSGEIQ